jgi:cob(I)alamin adenosyltransferase
MKIYTKAGDDGLTGLIAPGRLAKSDIRIEAYGTVDELNAALGLARALPLDRRHDILLDRLQNELFAVGSALADPQPDGPFHNVIHDTHIAHLERDIDALESELSPLRQFILPGGAPAAAHIHLARTICRRAERRVVGLREIPGQHVPDPIVIYLNRLSDLLFVLGRAVNQQAGVNDVPWAGIP